MILDIIFLIKINAKNYDEQNAKIVNIIRITITDLPFASGSHVTQQDSGGKDRSQQGCYHRQLLGDTGHTGQLCCTLCR